MGSSASKGGTQMSEKVQTVTTRNPARQREHDELKALLDDLGIFDDVDVLYFDLVDKLDEVENGWPVQDGLRKAFINLERAIDSLGRKRKFISSPRYHKYLRLKNNTTKPLKNGVTHPPTIPKKYQTAPTPSPRKFSSPRSIGSIEVEPFPGKQRVKADAEINDLKQQLISQKNTSKVKDIAHQKLQEEIAMIHKERSQIDKWIVDIGDELVKVASLQTQGVHVKGITDIKKLPPDADPASVLQATFHILANLHDLLPAHQEFSGIKSDFDVLKMRIMKMAEQQNLGGHRSAHPHDTGVEDLIQLLNNLEKSMSHNKENIRSLESQLKILEGMSKNISKATGPKERPPTPPTKLEIEEAKELAKRSLGNKEYQDDIIKRIKEERELSRRLEKLKLKMITLKLLGGKQGHTPGLGEDDIPKKDENEEDGEDDENFDPLLTLDRHIRITDNIIPELEGFLMIAEVGQRIAGAVDVMYTFYCSDVLDNHQMIVDEIVKPTATDLYEKYKLKLDEILSTLNKNKTDIDELHLQNTKLEEKAILLKEKKKEVRKLQYEKEKVTKRLIKETGTELVRDLPNIVDVVDKKTNFKIWVEYDKLYEKEWQAAYTLEKEYLEKPPRLAIDALLKILKETYNFCLAERDKQWQAIKCALYWEDRTDKEIEEEHAVYIKQLKKLAIPSHHHVERHYRDGDIPEDVQKEYSDKKFDAYIEKCFRLCWYMALQEPPVWLHWKVRYREFMDGDTFNIFTLNGRRVDFLVWPALLLHEGGPLLTKGVVQPIFLD